ncbi:MAG: hypothetical protein AB1791_11270 [Chloroflexota bacterium]
MQQWEYIIVYGGITRPWIVEAAHGKESLGEMAEVEMMNKLGQQGWELIAVSNRYYFRRPKSG